MSSAHPLRERLQSNSPEPDPARPTTPLRINKHPSPGPRQSASHVQVARRSSTSFKHVRDNNLVTKSPFRTLIPHALASPRKVSGEKRPRPDSMHSQAENEKPLGFKRRQSKGFQGLLQKEPVTKSPFRHSSESSSDPPPPLVPPKVKLRELPQSAIPVPSPVRGVLSSSRKVVGPRSVGEQRHHRRKTVTFDERCDVLEFSAEEDGLDEYLDDGIYSHGFSYDTQEEDQSMEDSFESGLQPGDDSITGLVDSILQAARPHTPPRSEDEEDVELLPPSPSPAKHPRPPRQASPHEEPQPEDSQPQIKDEDPPPGLEESFHSLRSVRSNDSLEDPSNLSIGHSEVSLTNLDSASLLADSALEGDVFAPVADSSPRSRSGTPLDRSLDRSFERALNRSLEARTTPSLTASRLNSPRSGSGSPFPRQLFKPSSTSSLGSIGNTHRRASPLITREAVQERLLRRKSEEVLSVGSSPVPTVVEESARVDGDAEADVSRATEPGDEPPRSSRVMARGQNPTHDGVVSIDPEPQPIDPPRPSPSVIQRAHTIDIVDGAAGGGDAKMDAKRAFAGLELDFEHGFGLGEEGMSVSAGLGVGIAARAKRHSRSESVHGGVHLGDVSALDRLMEDIGHGAGADSSAVSAGTEASVLSTEEGGEPGNAEGRSFVSLKVETVTEGVRGTTYSLPDIVRDEDGMDMDIDVGLDRPTTLSAVQKSLLSARSANPSPPPPPPPPKDARRAREQLILAKKREQRRAEYEEESEKGSPAPEIVVAPRPASALGVAGRSTPVQAAVHRRAKSSVDDGLLDVTPMKDDDAPLAATINRELKKREGRTRAKYQVREHSETIYASADAPHANGETNSGKAWRTIRRPSDMNEHAKQLKELREQQKNGKAHGKVFVKVVGLRNLDVPVPAEPTVITCTLNNGIHFVTTPDAALGKDCAIDQEFELIEHSKLEFTLTIKVKRDPHVVAQFKACQPPPQPRPPPQPLPPPASKGGSNHAKGGGMRSFLFGSPKKGKTAQRAASPVPPPPPPHAPAPTFKLPENLARYLKPDGTLARAFISFKDIAPHCDTRLMETTFPLIGQKTQVGTAVQVMQVGEIVLHIFRLPPLPGIPPEQLPQSLEECHRGLTHTRWHKSCYMQGTLTQLGGDCNVLRRRHLRIIGCSLIAYNDVTRRAIASIDLRKATAVDDGRKEPIQSPASGGTAHSYDDDDAFGAGRHGFQLKFGSEHITFVADTEQEKDDWVNILKALVGRIPPNPLWAELLFQRQEQLKHAAQGQGSGPPSSTSVSS
ncbi:hypothetical protein BD311DRAFT_703183 [Dichomitus squalens]|uniref:PH domain-containing protein n=1 Tax=Dichomitus squalens TaxID=114155 RepID=A0A4V2JZ63_9APHY|nr:hypothetical protein BD311DRAFT_703183 [Dichomitus squalens]